MPIWMVVEDEPGIYEMVMTMYDMMGVDGKAFMSGEEAIDWIEDLDRGNLNQELPELAILDIRLPGKINGAMVGERMRRSPFLKDAVIVLMTAYKLNPTEEREVIEQSGADLFLYKPLPAIEELHRILLGLLGR